MLVEQETKRDGIFITQITHDYKSKAFFVVISAFSCSGVIFFGSDSAAVSSIFCSGFNVLGKTTSK
eukprot:SAG31_NODE_2012_length_6668_cov_5.925407_4_plen_66_part_00